MTPGEITFWFCVPIVCASLILLFLYMQRYEIKITKLHKYLIALSEEQLAILRTFKYYNLLPTHEKSRFEKRVRHFLTNKEFIAYHLNDVTEEMKILIASACVQITFGHRPFYLSHFSSIHVYPSNQTNLKNIKEKKTLIISWSEFMDGYASMNDDYNPGMAALAMGLILEQRLREHSDKLFGGYAYLNWQNKSKSIAERFIQTGLTPFKNYNEIDRDEFFAISVVYFFENPTSFNTQFPELYKAMKKLLNQNPLGFYDKQ
jgi:Mlc titration factor MtfA (ptsG expression regulator)